MSERTHTPGPWVERDCEIQAADGSAICEMLARPEDEPKWGRAHADANSRLICAAPETKRQRDELLATLKGILTFVEDGSVIEAKSCGFVDELVATVNKHKEG